MNWASPDQRVLMRKGNLGQVTRGKTAFQAEVRGLAHRLNQPVGRAYGYSCDADLGDARCTIALDDPAFTGSGVVVSVTDNRRFAVSGLGAYTDQWFTGGRLVFTGGANAGRAMEVKRHAVSAGAVTIELWQAMSEAVAVGRCVHDHRRLRQAVHDLQGEVRQRGEFPRLPHHARQRRGDVLSPANQTLDGGSRYGN